MKRHLQTAGFILALAVFYFCAGTFGLSLATINPSASAVWPPSGIALATLLLWGKRLWPGVFAGAFAVNLIAQGSPLSGVTIAAGNTFEALLGAWLVCRFAEGVKAFERTRTILLFIVLTAVLTPATGATIGVTSLALAGQAQWDAFGAIWLTWWLGDAVGILLVTPLLVLWLTQPVLPLKPVQFLEALGLLVVLVLVDWALFLNPVPSGLEYFVLAPLLWAALRFGRRGAVTATFLMTGVALWGTIKNLGPFAIYRLNDSLLLLQVFIATVAATVLLMAAVILERRRLEQRLRIQDAVSRILTHSTSLTMAAPEIIKVLYERAGWELGGIWLLSETVNELVCVDVWSLPAAKAPAFISATRQSKFVWDVGLPGRVWSQGAPVWIGDVAKDANFPRSAAAIEEGLHAAIGFPIKLANEVLGVIECFSREIREPDDHFLQMAADIGDQLGRFIERRRAENALRESESRLQVALSAGQMGAWEWNVASNRVTWSPTLEALHGLKPGAFGGTFEDYKRDIHRDDLKSVLSRIKEAVSSGDEYHVAYRIIRSDGEMRWIEAFGRIVRDGEERPAKLAGVCMDITARKRAEEILQAKENQLRLITDIAPVMLVQCDRDGRYRFVNREYAERLGLTPEQIIGKTLPEIVGEAAYDVIRPHVRTLLEGNPVQYETEVPYQHLGRRYMHVAYVPEKDAGGEVTGWVSAISDITERKVGEETLQQRTRSLEITNQIGNALAGELDLAKIVQMVTDAGREISGAEFGGFVYNATNDQGASYPLYALSGVTRKAFEEFLLPLFGPAFKTERTMRIGDVLQDPRFGKRPDGHGTANGQPPVRSYLAIPVVSRPGEVLGGLFFAHSQPDVFTAEAEAIITAIAGQTSVAIDNANLYQMVQRRVEEFQKLINTAPVGIAVALDPECKQIWGNVEATRIFNAGTNQNLSERTAGGEVLPFKIYRSGREVPAQELPMQRACRQGIDVLDEELEVLHHDGIVVHGLCRATPLRDEDGKVRGGIGIFLNISERKQAEAALQQATDELAESNEFLERRVQERTADLEHAKAALLRDMQEQKRLEEQLRQAQKMESIGTLTGGIAHDFNNILNIIRSHASFVGELRAGDRELDGAMKIIDETIDRGTAIVQQLLAIARRGEAKLGQVDLNSLISKLDRLISETFPKTIAIVMQLDPALPMVTADANQIDQVLLNVSLNARDAMPEGGQLVVKTATVLGSEVRHRFTEANAEHYALISIADTGLGMNETVKNRIFEPFYSTKDQSHGTGLGLSVVYGIVSHHGGFIDVTSVPYEGTTFDIYLPVGESESNRLSADRDQRFKNETENRAKKHTILFVEDEIRQLELMRRLLEHNGYQVMTSVNGAEAVELFLKHKQRISVVVLDLGLPGLNGWEAFQKMREAQPGLKAILATGYISPEIESATSAGQLNGVIMKPYQLKDILGLIAAAVANFPESSPAQAAVAENAR